MSAVVACGDDGGGGTTAAETDGTSSTTDGTTMSSTSPSTSSSTTDSSTSTSSSTTDDTTSESSGSTTRGESESSATDGTISGVNECDALGGGGEPMCDPLPDQKVCEANEICLWAPPGYCYANCTAIAEEDACCSEFGCIWFEGACDYGGI